MTDINVLQNWFIKNSKSDVSMGIQITADFKGQWQVFIDLFDTELEDMDFQPILKHTDDTNWVRCIKENQMFKGYGGLQNLEDIINIFCRWIDNSCKKAQEY